MFYMAEFRVEIAINSFQMFPCGQQLGFELDYGRIVAVVNWSGWGGGGEK